MPFQALIDFIPSSALVGPVTHDSVLMPFQALIDSYRCLTTVAKDQSAIRWLFNALPGIDRFHTIISCSLRRLGNGLMPFQAFIDSYRGKIYRPTYAFTKF